VVCFVCFIVILHPFLRFTLHVQIWSSVHWNCRLSWMIQLRSIWFHFKNPDHYLLTWSCGRLWCGSWKIVQFLLWMIGEVVLELFTEMIVPRYAALSPSIGVSKISLILVRKLMKRLALFLATGTMIWQT
jgi:hypothetical protein